MADCPLPRYRGSRWLRARLPEGCELWLPGSPHRVQRDFTRHPRLGRELRAILDPDGWRWPKRRVLFFTDLHADADAFADSLVASGGVRKTGPDSRDLVLTGAGRKALFLIGGDCFDKGPSSLQLLRTIRRLQKRGARVQILAGNHDVRLMLGIRSLFLPPDPRNDHFFVRMGPKVMPLLREIDQHYLRQPGALAGLPPEQVCRRLIYPPEGWFREFPRFARWVMPDDAIEREMKRLRTKMERFDDDCRRAGLSLRRVYGAALWWQRQFLQPKGKYSWFFRDLRLASRKGSFLFIHGGLDDRIARLIRRHGVKRLNRTFREQLYDEPFEFYYGALANTVRTKYRAVDMPLTRHGAGMLRERGIRAVVHGHNRRRQGQRLALHKGLLHFECDATVDRNTRRREGLSGTGAAVTVFDPAGWALGISSDWPRARLFRPAAMLDAIGRPAPRPRDRREISS
ncbi:MAG TPA: metallophosphoesterase [Sedimenticola thiotaurini]|uniref:Metallophosphoesterase n=1 Tax=Sedimenticola thiotaurini TaxID=1543721 RepID=A0A831WA63_9GAMM|nr:metallophosphoesterase [Sedimenticola thiotaurini]